MIVRSSLLLPVEMPGVEPGSEVESPKHTTRVFDLRVLVRLVTDRQVQSDQYQCCLTLGPDTQLHASLSVGVTGVEDDRQSSVRWQIGFMVGRQMGRQVGFMVGRQMGFMVGRQPELNQICT